MKPREHRERRGAGLAWLRRPAQRRLPRRSQAQAVLPAGCRQDNTLALHDRIGQAGRDGTVVRSRPSPPDTAFATDAENRMSPPDFP